MTSPQLDPATGFEPALGHVRHEQITIGAAMSSRDMAEEIAAIVKAPDFYKGEHQTIFAAVERLLNQADTPVNPATVMSELVKTSDLVKVGGGPYLHTCVAAVPSVLNGPFHARKVRDDWRRRDLWAAGVRIVQHAGAPDFDPDSGFDMARAWIDSATADDGNQPVRDLDELTRIVLEEIDNGGGQPGLRTGFIDLDALVNGLRPGQLVVVAGRPGMGKTVIALNFAAAAAVDQRKRVHFHSLEMSDRELTMRLLSAEARVPLSRLRSGELEDRHWERLAKANARNAGAPLIIDDSASQSVNTIRGGLRAAARHDPAALVVVDYAQLLKSPHRIENRQQEVSESVRGLKDLAKEFAVPIVALAQLNRNPEQRMDKRPILADLRESGEFEQAADLVILLHREDAYERESPRAGEMDLIVAKQRNGPTSTVTVAFQGHYSRAVDLAPI